MSGCVHCLVVGLVPQVGVNPVMVSVQAKEKEVPAVGETVVQAIAKEKEVAAVETVTEQVTQVCIPL